MRSMNGIYMRAFAIVAAVLGIGAGWMGCGMGNPDPVLPQNCYVMGEVECPVSCNSLDFQALCRATVAGECHAKCDAQANANCAANCDAACASECLASGHYDCRSECLSSCGDYCDNSCAATTDFVGCASECRGQCDSQCGRGCADVARADCNAQCTAACQTSCVVQANVDCKLSCDIDAYADCKADLISQCRANCGGKAVLVCAGQDGVPPFVGPSANLPIGAGIGVDPPPAGTGLVTNQSVEADSGTIVLVDGGSDTWADGSTSGITNAGRR